MILGGFVFRLGFYRDSDLRSNTLIPLPGEDCRTCDARPDGPSSIRYSLREPSEIWKIREGSRRYLVKLPPKPPNSAN